MTHATNRIGRIGERLAERRLVAAGYEVLARNWRASGGLRGELDLVLVDAAGTVVFCEVKTRRRADRALPLFAVTWSKQQQLRRLAAAFLAAEGYRGVDVRFDVVAVSWPPTGGPAEILHVADAL